MSRETTLRAVARTLFPRPGWLPVAILSVWGGAGLVAAAWIVPASPWSQVALTGISEPISAPSQAARLVALSERATDSNTRAEALWQAALVTATDHHDLYGAIALLDQLRADCPEAAKAPRALAQKAELLRQLGDSEAANTWRQAAEEAPDHPRAGEWWLAAADLYSAGGQTLAAHEAYEAATRFPEQAGVAWLALGRIQLAHDPGAAHTAFNHAAAAAEHPATLRLARLGAATALERLDGPEAALAEVDDTIAQEGSDPSLERRRDRLRGGG